MYFRTWRWFSWSVGLGTLLPFGLLYVLLDGINHHRPSMGEIAGHGELFIVAAILLLGELRILRARRDGGSEGLFVFSLGVSAVGLAAWAGIIAAKDPSADVRGSYVYGTIYLVVTLFLGALAEGTSG